MINYVNTNFTLEEMARLNGTLPLINKWQANLNFLIEEVEEFVKNGRNNHLYVSKLIVKLSHGELSYGGQGNKDPDLYYGETSSRIEQKSFEKGKSAGWVAKSKFFANNSGTKILKEFLQTNPTLTQKKGWMIDNSYSDDDYYLLTSTAQWDGDINSTLCFFVEARLLQHCLMEEYQKGKPYCFVNLELLLQKTQKLVEKNKISLAA